MRLLVLGGTRFLGRHLVEEAIRRGDEITLFHRGEGGCSLFPEVRHVHGDRDGGLDALPGETWDAVVDTCGYLPRLVGDSTRALASRTKHYSFVSSISVYPEFTEGMTEDAPVAVLEDETVEEITPETYGGLKVLCEKAAEAAMPGRVLHVRSGMIVGPYDPTDRFTYWVRRVSMGGEVFVPGPPERPFQLIHAADQAAWILSAAEREVTGVFNVTGPSEPHTMKEVLEMCKEASGSGAQWVWAPEDVLLEHKVAFWSEVPFIIEKKDRDVFRVDVSKAVGEGLKFRPLLQTVRETLAWDAMRDAGTTLKAGLSPEREQELLRAVLDEKS